MIQYPGELDTGPEHCQWEETHLRAALEIGAAMSTDKEDKILIQCIQHQTGSEGRHSKIRDAELNDTKNSEIRRYLPLLLGVIMGDLTLEQARKEYRPKTGGQELDQKDEILNEEDEDEDTGAFSDDDDDLPSQASYQAYDHLEDDNIFYEENKEHATLTKDQVRELAKNWSRKRKQRRPVRRKAMNDLFWYCRGRRAISSNRGPNIKSINSQELLNDFNNKCSVY